MGIGFAPSYANIFMTDFEERAIKIYHLKPLIWKRFIDDIFMIWTHGKDELAKFLEYLNSLHRSIKFTCESSTSEIAFLDTMTKIDEDTRKVYTTLYTKPTDTHSYLYYTSSHPKNCVKNGPYGQFLRLRRICQKNEDFIEESEKMIHHYLQRGYPKKLIMGHFRKANQFTQEDVLKPKKAKSENNTNRPILITQYHPQNPDLRKIIDKHWNIIEFSRDCSQLFKKPIIGYRRLPNLRDKLTNAKCLLNPEPKTKTMHKIELCKKFLTCKYCRAIKHHKTTYNHNYAQSWDCILPPKSRITCKLSNVIYCIKCTKCDKQYVGETARPIQRRMYEHILSVEKPQPYRDTPVSRHFLSKGHSKQHMEFHLSEWCNDKSSSYRKERESYWIWKKKTTHNFGINQMM